MNNLIPKLRPVSVNPSDTKGCTFHKGQHGILGDWGTGGLSLDATLEPPYFLSGKYAFILLSVQDEVLTGGSPELEEGFSKFL